MVGGFGAKDTGIMKRNRGSYQTRAKRARRDFWMRLGVWIFIVFFALSVAGGLIVVFGKL
jgi:hypothetical protein